jgi:hypothetical protein
LFALLVVFGIRALKDRSLPVRRFLVIPALFIGWGIVSLAFRLGSSSFLIVDWVVCALIGAAVGLATSRTGQLHFEQPDVVSVKGSALPLIRNLVIFAAKYGLTAAATIHPTQRAILERLQRRWCRWRMRVELSYDNRRILCACSAGSLPFPSDE